MYYIFRAIHIQHGLCFFADMYLQCCKEDVNGPLILVIRTHTDVLKNSFYLSISCTGATRGRECAGILTPLDSPGCFT